MNLNLLDIAKLNGSDAVVGLIEEVIDQVPELGIFPARTISGTSFKTVTRTGLPSVGFRGANEGVTPSKSTFVSKVIEMYILDGQIEVDKAVADADERGAAHIQAIESVGVGLAALIELSKQIYYGTSNDSKGFPGLKAFTPFGGDYTKNAGGTTAATASSVYGVRFGDQDASMLWGNNTTLTLGDWMTQQLTDGNGKKYTGYVNSLGGWAGLQLANKYCAGRICNLTADSGKGLTEDLIHEFLDLFPAAKSLDALFLSKRSMTQLRKSMTPSITLKSTSLSGSAVSEMHAKAAIEEATGLKLVVTDAIGNTDALES